jgi:hypothetical protein
MEYEYDYVFDWTKIDKKQSTKKGPVNTNRASQQQHYPDMQPQN